MKRFILLLMSLLLMFIYVKEVKAESIIEYGESKSGISLTDNTLTIDDGISINDSIYADDDLNIILKGKVEINADVGIECEGLLNIASSEDVIDTPTLTINYSSIGVLCPNYPFKLSNVKIIIKDTSVPETPSLSAYKGQMIVDSLYIKDFDGNVAYYNIKNQTLNTYLNKDLIEDNIPIKNLIIEDIKLAKLANIDSSLTKVFKGNNEYKINNGFIDYIPSINSSVSYEPSINTHYVDIFNDFNEEGIASNFIEYLFNTEDWGKVIKYKVLECKNFYQDVELTHPFLVGETYYTSIIGNDVYQDESANTYISNFFLFVTDNPDNKLVLQLIGDDDPEILKYINLRVSEVKEDEEKEEANDKQERNYEYTFVNTGVTK